MSTNLNEQANSRASRWWIVVVLATLAAFAAWMWWSRETPFAEPTGTSATAAPEIVVELSPQAQQSAKLKIVDVQLMPLQRNLTANGVIAPDQNRIAHLHPLSRGIVDRVLVQLGTQVEKGAALLEYDNMELGELVGSYRTLQAELAQEQARAEVAGQSLERARALLESEAIARKEVELRAAELKQTQAAASAKRAQLAQLMEKIRRLGLSEAELNSPSISSTGSVPAISHTVLRAPFAGVITRFDAATGEVLEPANEVFTLADTSVIWALASIFEKDLGQVRTGQPCRVRVPAYPEEVFNGSITYVSVVLDPESRTSTVRCVVDNSQRKLRLEMFATVEMPLTLQAQALVLPDSALQVMDNQPVVFVAKDSTHFEKRVVAAGERSGPWTEIKSGLQVGERVVTDGAFYVKSAFLRDEISGEE